MSPPFLVLVAFGGGGSAASEGQLSHGQGLDGDCLALGLVGEGEVAVHDLWQKRARDEAPAALVADPVFPLDENVASEDRVADLAGELPAVPAVVFGAHVEVLPAHRPFLL